MPRTQRFEQLEQRLMLDAQWQNPARPADVNNDGIAVPLDALLVLNRVRDVGVGTLPQRTNPLDRYYDVSGDGQLAPLDALLVLNEIGRSVPKGHYISGRIEGESEVAPAGFISMPLALLPGQSGELVDLATSITIGSREFNEIGVFVVDTTDGTLGNLSPSSPGYADAVFASGHRHVLYSRRDILRDTRDITLPANSYVHVYVLQAFSEDGDAAKHIRVQEPSTGSIRIGWEEQPVVSPWPMIGDRHFDDIIVDVQVGPPYGGTTRPVLNFIPNQTVAELTELQVQAIAVDAELPNDLLTFSLDVSPPGVSINPISGLVTWSPTEVQGPDIYPITIRVKDQAGNFDTRSFQVTVLEVNLPPVMEPISNRSVRPTDVITINTLAADPDFPANRLTYSLDVGSPAGASIDSVSGQFRWTAPEVTTSTAFPITVRVTDGGAPRLSATQSFTITVNPLAACAFDDQLTGWTVIENGGSNGAKGTVASANCTATITEGDSFVVGLKQTFAIPATPTAIQFNYTTPAFDLSDPSFINDAFEVSLVDGDGNSLVSPFTIGRDAFFNITEGMERDFSSGIVVNGNTVTVGLNGIPADIEGTLIFRLINNDSDTSSAVTINNVQFVSSDLSASRQFLGPADIRITPFHDSFIGQNTGSRDSYIQVATAQRTATPASTAAVAADNNETPSIINFIDFGDTTLLSLNGSAEVATSPDGNVLRLTPADFSQAGSAFSQQQVNARDFSTYFTFRITNPGGEAFDCNTIPGADGIVFAVQSVSSSIGGLGQGIGYAGIENSVGVEFDSWCNAANNDPNSNHLGIVTDGDVDHGPGSPHTIAIAPDFDNGDLWYSWIDYDGQTLEVRLSQTGLRPEEPTLVRAIDIPAVINSDTAFVGFTSGTGSDYGNHDIVSWQYVDKNAPIDSRELSITATTPVTQTVSGTEILLSGFAESVFSNGGFGAAPPFITHVTVNGTAVDVLDSTGRFFTLATVLPGVNRFQFTAYDDSGLFISTELRIDGVDPQSDIDFSRLADITGSFNDEYFRTSFNDQTRLLYVDLATRNNGQFVSDVPLLVGVKNISDPSVRLVDFDGFMPDGTPYYDYTDFVAGGRLQPGQSTESSTVLFHNPNRVQFAYEMVFLGKLNEAPYFTSVPPIEVIAGRTYTYDAGTVDPDEDALTYSLFVAPSGMTIDANTGVISWSTTNDNIGQHDIAVRASDGRGGSAEHRYTLSVIEAPANRPPFFTSVPAVDAYQGRGLDTILFDVRDPNLAQWEFSSGGNGHVYQFVAANGIQWTEAKSAAALLTLNGMRGHLATITSASENGFVQQLLSSAAAAAGIFTITEAWIGAEQQKPNGPAHESWQWVTGERFSYTNWDADEPNDSSGNEQYLGMWGPGSAGGPIGTWNDQGGLNDPFVAENIKGYLVEFEPAYSYDANAVDPDDDVLSYSLVSGPDGMTVDESTGLVHWLPNINAFDSDYLLVATNSPPGACTCNDGASFTWEFQPQQPLSSLSQISPDFIDDAISVAWSPWRELFVGNRHGIQGNGIGSISRFILSDAGSLVFNGTITGNALESVHGLAFSPGGELFAANYSNGLISRFSFDPGRNATPNGTITTGPGLNLGLAFSSSDELFLTRATSEVLRFRINPVSGDATSNGTFTVPNASRLHFPAFSRRGELYLPDVDTDRIHRYLFTANGSPVANGSIEVSGGPIAVAFVGDRELFVASHLTGGITRFALDSAQAATQLGFTQTANAGGLAILPPETQHEVTLRTSDGRGGFGLQQFTINLHPDSGNLPPAIISQAATTARAGALYTYDVDAIDPDLDQLTYSLRGNPIGMTIDEHSGVIQWQVPDVGAPIESTITVRVKDERGGDDLQTFTITLQQGSGSITGIVLDRSVDGSGRVYSAADGFSSIQNPNGPWISGALPATSAGSEFAAYTTKVDNTGVYPEPLTGWTADIRASGHLGQYPLILFNPTEVPYIYGNEDFTISPRQLLMHPGPNGERAVNRFIVPASGSYTITAVFDSLDLQHGTTDVQVLVNGVSIFDGIVSDSSIGMNRQDIDLESDATVDFIVGDGGNGFLHDSTSLDATVTFNGNSIRRIQSSSIVTQSGPLLDPSGIAITPDGSTLYVTDYSSNALFRVPTNGDPVTTFASGPLLENTRGLAISPDGQSLYVAGWARGEIVRVPLSGGEPVVIPSGGVLRGPHDIDVSPDGTTLYIVDSNAGIVYSLPIEGGLAKVLASSPFGTFFDGPTSVAVTQDGKTLYVSAGTQLFSLPTTGGVPTLIRTIPGSSHGGIELSSDEKSVYFLDQAWRDSPTTSSINVIPLNGGEPKVLFNGPPLSAGFFGILSPDGASLYVADQGFIDRYGVGPNGEPQPARILRFDLEEEAVLPGWTVYLDQNQNGRRDNSERSTVTDATGTYSFTNLPPGQYYVAEEGQSGWHQTFPTVVDDSNLIVNGGFESGVDPGIVVTLPQGSEEINGWTIARSTIDLVGTQWVPFEGTRSIELTGAGTIAQQFQTIPGARYRLGFHYAGNPTNSPTKAEFYLRIANDFFDFSFDSSNSTFQDMRWQRAEVDFTANEALTRLEFQSFIEGAYGATIDNVSVHQLQPTTHVVALANSGTVSGVNFQNIRIESQNNRDPIIHSAPRVQAIAGESYRYFPVASDPDGDILDFSLSFKPDGMAIDPQSGSIVWSPKSSQVGMHDVLLRTRDGKGGFDLQSFRINVLPANTPPRITSAPRGPAVASLPYEYRITAIDAEGDSLEFSLTSAPTGMTIDKSTGLLTWTPTVEQIADHTIELLATDGRGGIGIQTIVLAVVVSADNDPPVIHSIPASSAQLGRKYLYRIDAEDPNGDPLHYVIATGPSGMQLDTNGLLSWSPNASQLGQAQVTLQVEDGRGGIASQTFTIVVAAQSTNGPPQIVSNPSQSASVGLPYFYDARAFDSDGDLVVWDFMVAPRGMSLDPVSGRIRWTPGSDQLSDHDVVLRVTDSFGATSAQTFRITVRGSNIAPQIVSVPPTQASVDEPYVYPVRAVDPEHDEVTFVLVGAPSGMTIDSTSGLIRWLPAASHLGLQVITVQAIDIYGNVGQQFYGIGVNSENPNGTPTITSQPPSIAAVGSLYHYPVAANDPDNDLLTFTLVQPPSGMSIDAGTGVLQWTPGETQVGSQTVQIVATDPLGNRGLQTFSLPVSPPNRVPFFTSTALRNITAGESYRYDVRSTDPDGDLLSISLTSAPIGMSVDNFGRVQWATTIADIGSHPVFVTVSDGKGGVAEQKFIVQVARDEQAPLVAILLSTDPVALGDTVTIRVVATDNVGIVSRSLTINEIPIALTPEGIGTFVASNVGPLRYVASAVDFGGNVGQSLLVSNVVDRSIIGAPEADIISPAPDSVITDIINIIGTANDPDFDYYTIEIAKADGGSFTEIARSSNPVVNGILGQLDPSLLANDAYILRLTVRDRGFNVSTAELTISVAGELKLGNFTLSFTDLTVPVSGIPIILGRTYDSLNASVQDDFGYGWRMEIRDSDLRTSVPQTSEAERELGFYNAFTSGARVYITVPGGKREGFTFRPVPDRFFGLLEMWKIQFEPDPGVTSTLSVEDFPLFRTDDGLFVGYTGGGNYNPASPIFGEGHYTLKTKEGIVYTIDGNTGDTQRIADPNNNTLTFTNSEIISSSGQQITFERDIQGRITAVIDPSGNRVRYTYDANGDLVSVIDRAGNTTRLEYRTDRPHYLEKIIDPLGRDGIRSEYDPSTGRLSRLLDASGKSIQLSYDTANSIYTTTDQLGNATTYEYDNRGNIVTQIDPAGGVVRTTYDANNNLLTETDPLGNTSSYTYDNRGNQLTSTDPLGRVTRYTYGVNNQVVTSTDPLGDTTVNNYDSIGNLTSIVGQSTGPAIFAYDTRGNLTSLVDGSGTTTFEYDGAGRVTKQLDALGNATSYTYDANGRQLSETRSLTTPTGVRTLVSRTEYDAEGRVIKTIDAEGGITQHQYDFAGNRTATIDARGFTARYNFNDLGQLIETIFPDQTPLTDTDNPRTRTEYDAAGRVTAEIDELGRHTLSVFDSLGRNIETIFPDSTPGNLLDNPRTRTEYDLAGRVTAEFDERGNATRFVYDSAGQLFETILADSTPADLSDNPRIRVQYNEAGRRTVSIDPLGVATQYVYDSLGRLTETRFADGGKTVSTFDSNGRLTGRTDQEGQTTHYEYDALRRLTAVVDALGNRTVYAYDEAGNLVRQQDANGNSTRYEYDGLNRRIATQLPLDQRSTSQYDPLGNVTSTTDFNGDTIRYEYDARGRLTAKQFPDLTSVNYAYTLTSQRAAVVDARGMTTYQYDSRDRLLSRVDPDGRQIAYEYDAVGNRTSLILASGTTQYTFDSQNRLETVTDPEGGLTRYQYNNLGALVRTDLPNGTYETRSYDQVGRLNNLENHNFAGLINRFAYTLDKTGNRTRVAETHGIDSRQVDYAYDAVYKLLGESITDATNGDRTIGYTYDNVGNRLSRVDSVEGNTTYSYDANDRLLAEDFAGVVTQYEYDANGNTLSKFVNATDQVFYDWDYENRLIEADVTEGSSTRHIENRYDADGIRVAQIIDGSETRYLIDTVQPYAQVVMEYTPGGVIKVSYIHGLDLISQNRPAETGRSFYHVDGLGSTRALSNASGLVTDRYIYDAFGRSIGQVGSTGNMYLFAGEQRDSALDLDYLRARYMNPSLGRFVSVDPFEGFLRDPLSLQDYLYAHANPASNIDPSGEVTLGSVMAAVAVRAVIFTIQHPFLTAAIGLAVNVALPVEWNNAMIGSGLPPFQFAGRAGLATKSAARFVLATKNPNFTKFVQRLNQSAAGQLSQKAGQAFEELFVKVLPGARRQVPLGVGKHTADFLYRGWVIEIKSGKSIDTKQLKAIASFAEAEGLSAAYYFLTQPSPSVIQQLRDAGVHVVSIF